MVWKSLRSRILLLAVLTSIFFGTAAGSFYLFLRNNHALTVGTAHQQLAETAEALGHAYTQQASTGMTLEHVELPAPPAGPPQPPPASGPPPPPIRPYDPYAEITTSVLAHRDGIEGGFFAASGALVGYAFPTHEGPGPKQEMPMRERTTIEDLARKAKDTATAQQYTFEGDHDVVLFAATPVRETVDGKSQVTGAAWLMQRLPGVNAGRSRQLLFAALGLGGAMLVTAILAWIALFEIRGGLDAVKGKLTVVKTGKMDPRYVLPRNQLQEFTDVLNDIDVMALALEQRTVNGQRLEAELRHRERLSALGQFAAGVAHELRNPLATIRLRAQMSETSQPQAIARNSQVIQEEVDRLDVMIERLLSFARPISLDRQLLELASLCRACADSWQQRAGDKVHVSCVTTEEVTVLADRSRLLQVLDNLIENAVQAVQEKGGALVVHVSQEDGVARVGVSDDGPGFSPEAARHAMDAFYTTKDAGTGLGLSIAFELIQAHGGNLEVFNQAEGATVSFTLAAQQTEGGHA